MLAAEDTVRAEVDHPSAPLTGEFGQLVGEQGVDRDTWDRGGRFLPLLDDSDAVDDEGGLQTPQVLPERCQIHRIHVANDPPLAEEVNLPIERYIEGSENRAGSSRVACKQGLVHLVSQHSVPAEDEDLNASSTPSFQLEPLVPKIPRRALRISTIRRAASPSP